MDISIVIPMHNEEEALLDLFPALDRFVHAFGARYSMELILLDDKSTDHSFDLAYRWADNANFPVKVIGLDRREGIGGALRQAFVFCVAEVIVTYDADMSYPIDDIPKLYEALFEERGADLCTASPFHGEGSVDPSLNATRHGLSQFVYQLYRLRLGAKRVGSISCFTCGFRAYRREKLLEIEHRHNGFLATAEILVRALLAGQRIVERPSVLGPRTKGRSKMRFLSTAWSHIMFLIRLR